MRLLRVTHVILAFDASLREGRRRYGDRYDKPGEPVSMLVVCSQQGLRDALCYGSLPTKRRYNTSRNQATRPQKESVHVAKVSCTTMVFNGPKL